MTQEQIQSQFYFDFIDNINAFVAIQGVTLEHTKSYFLSMETISKKLDASLDGNYEELERLRQEEDLDPNEDTKSISFTEEEMKLLKRIVSPANLENFLRYQRRYLIQFLFSELENYLFRSFKYILLKYPNLLDKKQISVKKIRNQHFNLNAILEEIAEKEIHDEFYNNFSTIFKYGSERLGVKHEITDEKILKLEYYKGIRNIFVHGDGRVTSSFLTKVSDSNYRIDDKLVLADEMLSDLQRTMVELVRDFDSAFISQFSELVSSR